MDAATSPRPDVCAADRARRKLRAEANRLCKREGRSAPALPVLFCADCEMFMRYRLPAHIARRAPAISTLAAQIEMFMRYRLPAHIARLSRRVGSSRANRDAPPRDPAFPRQLPSAALPKESPHIFRAARSAMTAAARSGGFSTPARPFGLSSPAALANQPAQ